jgi:chemotaxis protein MotB
MIVYADFVTLLFAVFVVLYTAAATNKGTAKQVSEAVIQALRGGTRNTISRSQVPRPVAPEKVSEAAAAGSRMLEKQTAVELVPSMEALSRRFQDEMANGQIDIHLEARGLVISLRQAAFFASGKADLNPDTYLIVDKLAGLINSLPNHVNLEGHTDAVPIRNSRFASNWELSAARSIAMLDRLASRGHVDRSRVSIAGYADTVPVASNEDEKGRSRNRRVDIVILNQVLPQQALEAPK